MQPHGERRDGDRQRGHDHHRQEDGCPREPAPVVRSQLSQLSDRRGRCLGTGGKRHRHRKRQHHGQHRGALGAGYRRAPMSRHRVRETMNEHHDGARDEQQRHHREHQSSAVPEPRQGGDSHQQRQTNRDPRRRDRGHVGDQRADSSRDRDRDRQHEIDDQRADRQEHPAGAERPRRRLRRSPAQWEAPDQLPVVHIDQGDDRKHDDLRCHQQAEVPVQRAEGCLNRVRDRRNRIRHHRKREADEQQRPHDALGSGRYRGI